MRIRCEINRGGFALIITIITVALLTIMAVAFLSSTTLERATSRAGLNKSKADLSAKAAVEAAIARLIDNVAAFPDSTTAWEAVTDSAGASQYEGTVLDYRQQTPETLNNPPVVPSPTPLPLFVLPLISGAVAQPTPTPNGGNRAAVEAALRGALSTLTDANSYNLNHARFSGDDQGWIGSSPVWRSLSPKPTTPQAFRAKWIDLTDSASVVTARYAYWMEDESFKVNANLLGNTPRGSSSLGAAPTELPLQGMLKQAFASASPEPAYDLLAQEMFDYRARFRGSRYFEFKSINQPSDPAFDFTKMAEASKFYATVYSSALNLSRSGSKRVNLNKVVTDQNPAAGAALAQANIRTQLDEIIKNITYHLPNFGQRFYRTGSDLNTFDVTEPSPAPGPSPHRSIYLNKLAANIRDYIDTDSQPTIVNNDGDPSISKPYSVRLGVAPTNALGTTSGATSGVNEAIAIGKEGGPFLQEYVLRVKQLVFSNRLGTSAQYKIEIDHYLEFWNMTNRDITVANLGPNPFILIANQFGWQATGATPGTNILPGAARDIKIALSDFRDASGQPLVFRAGVPTVLTTDPTPLPSSFPNIDVSRVFRPSVAPVLPALRIYSGTTTYKASGSELRLSSIGRPTANGTDLETELVLGNDSGVLESFGSVAINQISVNVDDGTGANGAGSQKFDVSKYHYRASSLKGNSPVLPSTNPIVSQNGDPRTNNEQLTLDSSAAVKDDQTAHKSEQISVSTVVSASFTRNDTTLTALNSNFVSPQLWVDPSSNTAADASSAPAVIANAPLTSIGELGLIADPVRLRDSSSFGSGSILYSRGGGRTLKIGQPEAQDVSANPNGLWDGNSQSTSREWTAWRLADIFSTDDSIQLEGRININGVRRDNGAALKAALHGYSFRPTPHSDPVIASSVVTDAQIQALVDQLKARLSNDAATYSQFGTTSGPLAERGELSELPVFNSGTQLTGTNMSTIYDRGREELFRRLAELIATRGSVFTVYAVGQALIPKPAPSAPIVASTSQLKVTFRIDPVWDVGAPSDPFDPSSSTRFKKPDRYAVKILYAGE